MRIILIILVSVFTSCSGSISRNKNLSEPSRLNTLVTDKLIIYSALADTPKILKAGADYIIISSSPYDKIYFGDKFSPYKLEPYDIRVIEQILDSSLKLQNVKNNFQNKSLTDYKYQIYSVMTANKKVEVRVLAICNEQAQRENWNSSRLEIQDGGDCYFSLIYNLTDKLIISFTINSEG